MTSEAPERHNNTRRNLILNQTVTDLDRIINHHDPDIDVPINDGIWNRLDRMAVEIEDLHQQALEAAEARGYARAVEDATEIAQRHEDHEGLDQDGNPYVSEEAHLFGASVAHEIKQEIRALSPTPSAPAPVVPKVKPLRWEDKEIKDLDDGIMIHLGPYSVRLWHGRLGARLNYLDLPIFVDARANGLSRAIKTAAQADHESRTLAQIDMAPVTVQEGANG